MHEPSIGAKMWVQVATGFGKMIKLLPEDDRAIAMELIPILWSGDEEEVRAAEATLFELIDNPKMTVKEIE